MILTVMVAKAGSHAATGSAREIYLRSPSNIRFAKAGLPTEAAGAVQSAFAKAPADNLPGFAAKVGGAKGSRTPDLLNAIQALSQLSYGPYCLGPAFYRSSFSISASMMPLTSSSSPTSSSNA